MSRLFKTILTEFVCGRQFDPEEGVGGLVNFVGMDNLYFLFRKWFVILTVKNKCDWKTVWTPPRYFFEINVVRNCTCLDTSDGSSRGKTFHFDTNW